MLTLWGARGMEIEPVGEGPTAQEGVMDLLSNYLGLSGSFGALILLTRGGSTLLEGF